MRDADQKYYICKSGEVKHRAEEHRTTFLRLKDKLWEVVNSFGSERASIDTRMMLIQGIEFKGEPPVGWTKKKNGVSKPKRGTLPPEVRKFFTPDGSYYVTPHEDLNPLAKWLNCPFGYSWKSKDGKSSGMHHLGRLFSDGFTYWYDKDGPIMLELPDVAKAKAESIKRGEIVENNVLDWVPPKGLKEILPEEWDLMAAKHKKANP